MSFENAMQRLLEYKRLYIEGELTEEGVFLVGEVPEDYAGTFLAKVEVCYAILSVDISGRLRLRTYNPPDIKNKDRVTGLPIKISGEHQVRAGSGSPDVELKWRENAHLPSELKETAAAMWVAMQREIGEWVL